MGEYPAYDDDVYDAFDTADDRCRAYRDAIRSAAADRVVLDIGTGRDALWAIEAARSGARHVYAIEADPTAAARAAQTVATAGLGDRVTVLPGLSTEQTLPVRAELCVSEIIGNIASAEGAIPVLLDARHRLTAPGCVWIPFRMQTWAAAVDLTTAAPLALAAETVPYLRAVFAAAGAPFDPRLCLAGPAAETIVSTAAPLESAVFTDDRWPAADAATTAGLRIEAAARVTGLLLWVRVAASSAGGREIDALAAGTRGWAPVYVPISPAGRPVRVGDRIRVGFARRTGDDNLHPDYEITVDGRRVWHSPHHGGPFRASEFYRGLFSLDQRLDHW
jgi:protein arginine N-methyltransferase 1